MRLPFCLVFTTGWQNGISVPLKNRVFSGGDDSMDCIVKEGNIYPDYYGMDMVISLAFQRQSPEAKIF